MNHSRNTWAMSLLEVMVGFVIGTLLVGLAWSGVYQTRNIMRRATVNADLHSQAASIHSDLAHETADLHPGCAIHLNAKRDSSGCNVIELTWMTSVMNNARYGLTNDQYYGTRSSLVWNRWRWERSPSQVFGRLLHAVSSDLRQARYNDNWWLSGIPGVSSSISFGVFPCPRRSAERPLDDNDMRLLDNYQQSVVAKQPLPGDDTDLDSHLVEVYSRVNDWAIDLVDANGVVTDAISESSCSDSLSVRIDGCWLDGHDLQTISKRPAMIRFGFTLFDLKSIQVRPQEVASTIKQTFGFSYLITSLAPRK